MVNHSANIQRALDELHALLRTQAELLAGIRAQFFLRHTLADELAVVPKTGTLMVEAEVWDFTRHGSGILFQGRDSRRIVDVHERLDEPVVFDTWRLGTYFRSLGRKGQKLVERAVGRSDLAIDDAIALLADEFLHAGLIEADGNGFRLSHG